MRKRRSTTVSITLALVGAVLTFCESPTSTPTPSGIVPRLAMSESIAEGGIETATIRVSGAGIRDSLVELDNDSLHEGQLETTIDGSGSIEIEFEGIPAESASYVGAATQYADSEVAEVVNGETTEVVLRPGPVKPQLFGNLAGEGAVRLRDLDGTPVHFEPNDFWPDTSEIDPTVGEPQDYTPALQIHSLPTAAFYVVGLTRDGFDPEGLLSFQTRTGEGRIIDTSAAPIDRPYGTALNRHTDSFYALRDGQENTPVDVYDLQETNDPVAEPTLLAVDLLDLPDDRHIDIAVSPSTGHVYLLQADGPPDDTPTFTLSRFDASELEGGQASPGIVHQMDAAAVNSAFELDFDEVGEGLGYSISGLTVHEEKGVLLSAHAVDEDDEEDEVYESGLLVVDQATLEYDRTITIDELGGFEDDGNLPLTFLATGRQYATLRTFRDHADYPNGRFITVDLDTGEVVAVAFAEDLGIPEADQPPD